MKLKNITVQIGGFHDHWLRNSTDTSGLLIALVGRCQYDFICLMDYEYKERAKEIKKQVEKWIPGFKVHLGHERMYGWGHVVSVENDDADYNLQSIDFIEEFKKCKKVPGLVALAHISHPTSKVHILKSGYLDCLIDENYVDAVQIEKGDDMKYLCHRLENNKKVPLITGFDSHMLNELEENDDCFYSDYKTMFKHIDALGHLRTIVFCDDNSLESIKGALKEGKSVVEDVLNNKFYGNFELIKLLKENDYEKIMHERNLIYEKIKIEYDSFLANSCSKLQFSLPGEVLLPVDEKLNIQSQSFDGITPVLYENIVMPVSKDTSYLPIALKTAYGTRYWAIKVRNDIQIDVYPQIKNNHKVLSLVTRCDFEGKIAFEKPYVQEIQVCAKKDEILYELNVDQEEDIFDYSFTAVKNLLSERKYRDTTALVKIHRYNNDWDNCHEFVMNEQRFCGGFGSNRPYPGEDVFAVRVQMQWDENHVYLRYNITDKVFMQANRQQFYYLFDSTYFCLDPEYKRAKIMGNTRTVTLSSVSYDGVPAAFLGDEEVKTNEAGFEIDYQHTEIGRIVSIKCPWKILTRRKIENNINMGFTLGVLNAEECGPVDNVNWPYPAKGACLFPYNWAVMGLTD